jgi:hypothetical protein
LKSSEIKGMWQGPNLTDKCRSAKSVSDPVPLEFRVSVGRFARRTFVRLLTLFSHGRQLGGGDDSEVLRGYLPVFGSEREGDHMGGFAPAAGPKAEDLVRGIRTPLQLGGTC